MVKVGLNFMGADRFFGGQFQPILQLAERADRVGIDVLTVPEHVVTSREAYESDVYFGGPFPYPRDMAWYDPIAFLGAIGAVTRTAQLSVNVLIAPLRSAVLLAKQLATLDVISNGRVSVAFGTGWQKAEFEASGVAFDGRSNVMEEQIAACRTLWGGAPASFEGEQISFKDLYSMPLPLQGRNLPIWLGLPVRGRHIDRLARLADGWSWGYASGPDIISEGLGILRPALERLGRDPMQYGVRAFPKPVLRSTGAVDFAETFSRVPALIEAGVTQIEPNLYDYCRTADEIDEVLERLLELKRQFT